MRLRLFCLAFMLLALPSAQAAELRVLGPAAEDCEALSLRLARMPRGRQEPARSLGLEGERLCRTGHIRTGVAKLRRALRAAQNSARASRPTP